MADFEAGYRTEVDLTAGRQAPARYPKVFPAIGVAIGSLWFSTAIPATADTLCTLSGAVQTCTGDQSDGVIAGGGVEQLYVNSLNRSIWPAPSVNGIDFQSNGPISIVSDTGGHWISTYGADGIHANTTGGSLSIDHTGNIAAYGGYGINAVSLGGISMTVDGDIWADQAGIYARNNDAGSILSIIHAGDIRSFSGAGIDVDSSSTPVSIDNHGRIWSSGDAISAVNTSAYGITIDQYGEIRSDGGRGIYANAALGAVSVNGIGDISAYGNGIDVLASSSDASVDYWGDITSQTGRGIMVDAPNGSASVTGGGAISSFDDGIFAQATGNPGTVTVSWTGDITSDTGRGVYGYAARGAVSVTTQGDIQSQGDGIFAANDSEDGVTVSHQGDINAGGRGVYAFSPRGEVSVTVLGADITAGSTAIYAANQSDGAGVTVDFSGNILQSTRGIHAETPRGAISVTANGDINSTGDGIFAQNQGEAAVTVNQTGYLNVGGKGIYAYSTEGAVNVTAEGAIDSGGDGIFAANNGDGAVIINSQSGINAGGKGIYAETIRGLVTIDSNGAIIANSDGIFAKNDGTTAVSVTSVGDIDAGSKGIYAYSSRGAVTVNSDGDITSSNAGIYAQNDSNSSAVGVSVTNLGNIDAGSTGIYARSTRGAVTVVSTGDIDSGYHGIFAENDSTDGIAGISITSMGNVTSSNIGVYAKSTRGAVSVNSTGDIDSGGQGIFAQNDSNSSTYGVTIVSAGNIDAGSQGIYGYSPRGAVSIESEGNVTATQDGIFAQNDASGSDAGVSIVSAGDITAGKQGIYGFSTRGAVTITSEGDIEATTQNGIFAQNDSNSADTGISISSDGDVNAGGLGVYAYSTRGAVSIDTQGDVHSADSGIVGINDGDPLDVAGSLVSITHSGDVSSTNGAGIVGRSSVSEVQVTLNDGDVTAAKDGISVESYNDLSVTVGEGASVTGAAGYAGVLFAQGYENSLLNYGTISNAGGLGEYAVSAAGNNIVVDNYGTIAGRVELGPWSNAFNNYEGALFDMGDVVNLTSGNTLSNWGVVSPGGVGNVQTTDLTGSLTNHSGGTLLFDVDMNGAQADLVNVSDQASLDGSLALNFVSANATPDAYTVITTGGGVTLQSLSLLNPMVTGNISYVNSGNDVQVAIDGFDFSPNGVVGNAASIGDYIGASFEGGSSGLDPIVLALLSLPSLDEANDALNQLSPNIYLGDQIAAAGESQAFADSMLSCRMAGGANAFGAEGQCVWGRGTYSYADKAGAGDYTGVTSRTTNLAGGAQFALKDSNWRLGGALGVRMTDRKGDGGSSSEGTSFEGGAVLKYAPGPYLLAGAISISRGGFDTSRTVDFPGFSDLLTGHTDVTTVNGRLRAALTLQSGNFYFRPQADFDTTFVHTGAFTETGGVASVSTSATSNTMFTLTPSVEIGGQVAVGENYLVRPYLRGGVSLYANNDFALSGVFSADTAGADPFSVTTGSDDVLWNVAAGVDILNSDIGTLQLFYGGSFGNTTTVHSAGAKFSVNF